MARFLLSQVTSVCMAIAFVVMSSLVAVLVNTSYKNDAPQAQASGPADLMSMIQGTPHVDRLSITENHTNEMAMLTKDVHEEMSHVSGASLKTKAESKPPAVVALASAQTVESASSLRTALHLATVRVAERMGKFSPFLAGGILVCVILALMLCLAIFSRPGPGRQGNAANNQPYEDTSAFKAHAEHMMNGEQRERMLVSPSPKGYQRSPGQFALPQPRSPRQGSRGMPGTGSDAFLLSGSPHNKDIMPATPQSFSEPRPHDPVKPSPICPTLVIPSNETLLGIEFSSVEQLMRSPTAEGDLQVVGVSGKSLLRTTVKKVSPNGSRSLEVAMPDQNSISRATITPSSPEGGRGTLEIRAMRGAFYGTLEKQDTGSCCVVRDGHRIMSIDGDDQSLQLSVKSAAGVQLASVRRTAEFTNGVDYIEIHVEPGVDTVLVVGVMVAVLLLVPHASSESI